MAKLSLIFPSRDERFLLPSIHDAFKNARGEFEVIAVIDSNLWPEGWKEITAQYPNLHTIFHGEARGLRAAINSGVGSAKSRGAKYIMKADAHCAFGEGFDEIIKTDMDHDWVVIPRRKRLDAENWTLTETHKPDIDYHYLSFPDDPQDFGGKGLNGKPWPERAVERKDILIDDEMASQGSAWAMMTDYFYELELMDEANYGPFWNESQEILNKCWLSGGRAVVNKKTWYAHLHKGKTHGRGYHLPEKWLKWGATYTKLWMFNEAWPKQTLPFEWLIDHFWQQSGGIPSWPENWREVLYATRKPRVVGATVNMRVDWLDGHEKDVEAMIYGVDVAKGKDRTVVHDGRGNVVQGLTIIQAHYGIGSLEDIDVRERLRNLAFLNKDSLDIVVNNSTLTPGQNPFRGKKKQLNITYSLDGSEVVTRTVEEKDWLIIGHQQVKDGVLKYEDEQVPVPDSVWGKARVESVHVAEQSPMTPAALNDYLIRKFSISPQRLRGPMPIELRDFHRNDLAQLFAELGFKRGAEIGVAEGNYSEIICKANPEVELFCVDPWYAYSTNPQNKSREKHEYAYNEAVRKLKDYNAHLIKKASIDAEKEFDSDSLDFLYVDGNHLYDFVSLDLILWSNKVRSGGIVSGDDYYALDQKRWVGGGVVEAVQAYVNAHRISIWWIFQGHKSTDYMWVKL